MSTKIKYDDTISTNGRLPMVESHPYIYNLIKIDEIINTFIAIIPSTQSNIFRMAAMFMSLEIYALLEPNP